MIKVVHEFFCLYGRCREVQLAGGIYYPILLSIEQMPTGIEILGVAVARLGEVATEGPALRIKYRGHKDDLLALGCISPAGLASAQYDRYEYDPRGAVLYVENKAAPGRRKMIELSYFAQSRAFAGMLPGVRTYCGDWLQALTARPMLRLVIDNTRTLLRDRTLDQRDHGSEIRGKTSR